MNGCKKDGKPVFTCNICHFLGQRCHGDTHNKNTVLEIYTSGTKHEMEKLMPNFEPEQLRKMLIEEIVTNHELREENEKLKSQLKFIKRGSNLIKNEPETTNLRMKILKRLK